jgi:DNA-binding beta-propeller fold protein YncE
MGNIPVLIGEVGIAYDLDGKRAYVTNDFSAQEKALNRTLEALDANILHYTLWNYTSDNTNRRGDHWNDEDLSIFSRDQQTDPADLNSGGRALKAVLRPYPMATGGEPLELGFDYKTREFVYRYRHQPGIDKPTIIYLPAFQYAAGCLIEISDGRYELDEDRQQLYYWHDEQRSEHQISIKPSQSVFS